MTVTPGSGTTACIGMLVATYIDLFAKRARLRRAARPVIAAVNATARSLDNRSAALRSPRPGTIFANYHVVAEPA